MIQRRGCYSRKCSFDATVSRAGREGTPKNSTTLRFKDCIHDQVLTGHRKPTIIKHAASPRPKYAHKHFKAVTAHTRAHLVWAEQYNNHIHHPHIPTGISMRRVPHLLAWPHHAMPPAGVAPNSGHAHLSPCPGCSPQSWSHAQPFTHTYTLTLGTPTSLF